MQEAAWRGWALALLKVWVHQFVQQQTLHWRPGKQVSYSLAEELSRKVGFSFPDLASKAQSSTPCHMGWYRPSQAGALGSPPALPPHHHKALLCHWGVRSDNRRKSKYFDWPGKKYISYQTWDFFCWGLSSVRGWNKPAEPHISVISREILHPDHWITNRLTPGDILAALSCRNPPPAECFLAPFIRSNHHLLTMEILEVLTNLDLAVVQG